MRKAKVRFFENVPQEYWQFCEKEADWLDDFALFMALKEAHNGAQWSEWERPLKFREAEAIAKAKDTYADEIDFWKMLQYLFFEQWCELKNYANERGIRIIGDVPIYVAGDSVDVWTNPSQFYLDENLEPIDVAGCPPDAFSATGQLWGNPLYDWGYHKKDHYSWWIKRMEYSLKLYDVVRVDHFRGFEAYYSIPYGDPTAEFGHWEKGPGLDLFARLKKSLKKEELPIIAEDLGFLTPEVHEMLKESGFPGMKVLEFAFDDSENSDYLPHKYQENCIVYTGTHDNETLVGWYENMNRRNKSFAREYMGCRHTPKKEMHWEFIRLAMASPAKLAVIPVQDYLGLGAEARINEPSTLGKNWKWRLLPGEITGDVLKQCRRMAKLYGRLPETVSDINM